VLLRRQTNHAYQPHRHSSSGCSSRLSGTTTGWSTRSISGSRWGLSKVGKEPREAFLVSLTPIMDDLAMTVVAVVNDGGRLIPRDATEPDPAVSLPRHRHALSLGRMANFPGLTGHPKLLIQIPPTPAARKKPRTQLAFGRSAPAKAARVPRIGSNRRWATSNRMPSA
jgi:hypothetical protein